MQSELRTCVATRFAEEFVTINGIRGPLSIRLPGMDLARPDSGVVSASRLLHPIPPKAYKEFCRSQKIFQAGDIRSSMQHLERAIQIDPDYMEAHNNLGVRYMRLEQYEKALTEFQKTIVLDPESAKGHLNLSLALSILRRYPEAEVAARRAVHWSPIPSRQVMCSVRSSRYRKKTLLKCLGICEGPWIDTRRPT